MEMVITLLSENKSRLFGFIILIIISFYSLELNSQIIGLDNANCSGLLNIKNPKFYNKYPYIKYSDFIDKYLNDSFPDSKKFAVYSCKDLINISCKSSSPIIQSFEGKIGTDLFQLKLYFSHHNEVLGNDTLIKDLMFDPFLFFQSKRNKYILGEIPNETRFHLERLDSVVLIMHKSKHIIWASNKYEIININREYEVPNCPNIKLLYSKNHKKLFLYFAFKNFNYHNEYENNSYYPDTDFPSTRFKLIIDPFTGNSSNMFIGGQWLYLYGWDNCPNFWPF
ncbi:MAG: hypothetical protein IPK88_01475 [Saprospiraceae bacterium]|nr:hypothetical protein [Candidatus Defluviibacterium haderslevense]MCC7025811.1 hypothetical protein [Saprospiraceae bacterium]